MLYFIRIKQQVLYGQSYLKFGYDRIILTFHSFQLQCLNSYFHIWNSMNIAQSYFILSWYDTITACL